MIRGVGVDMVNIQSIADTLANPTIGKAFLERTFTVSERHASGDNTSADEYYATRLAAKEATYKAIAPLLKEQTLDWRNIETLNRTDGSPYVHITDQLRPYLEQADIRQIDISLSTEDNYAIAFVITSNHEPLLYKPQFF